MIESGSKIIINLGAQIIRNTTNFLCSVMKWSFLTNRDKRAVNCLWNARRVNPALFCHLVLSQSTHPIIFVRLMIWTLFWAVWNTWSFSFSQLGFPKVRFLESFFPSQASGFFPHCGWQCLVWSSAGLPMGLVDAEGHMQKHPWWEWWLGWSVYKGLCLFCDLHIVGTLCYSWGEFPW